MTFRRDVGLVLFVMTILAAASLAPSACGVKKAPVAATAMTAQTEPELNAWIAVTSDPQSRYRALDVERAGRGKVRIIVERETSGVKHYDKRLINCERQLFSLEREADSPGALNTIGRAVPQMIPWAPGTPDDKIARYACAVAPL